jgi:diguanylate cyclase (GGDEF)-like protein
VLLGLALLWRQTDATVRASTRASAEGLAQFIATSFGAVEETPPGTPARVAHRAVTGTVRSDWASMGVVLDLRIIGHDGVVRWSKKIEEEDKPWPGAAELLATPASTSTMGTPSWIPLRTGGGGGEVIYPLGGVSCAGCHRGESTLKAGVLALRVDEPALTRQVNDIFLRALAAVVALGVAIALGVALSLRFVLTVRLSRLAAAMKRAEGGDLVVRAPNLGRDEVGQLADAFNGMLARLTDLKASEIDNQRDLDHARTELTLKSELERVASRLKTRVEELQILFDVARTVTSTLALTEVLERITSLVPARLEVPRFSIMLLNAEGLLEVQKAWPANQGSEGLIFAIGEGIAGHAAATAKSVYVADLEKDARFKVRRGQDAKGRGSMLTVPMMHGGELLGVLNFERPEKADFSADEIEFFTAVADQATMAVQNARLHERTVALSITDPLTGVPNRRLLFQQLQAEIDRANRFGTQLSVLMIDIDHFKHLNDTAGHSAGDEVLRLVATQLKTHLRRVDTLARYGGEEFVVLLPQVARQEAMEVAEKLRGAVEQLAVDHARVQPGGRVTISIGVANLPGDATEQSQLVDCADAALYASKRGGRNKVTPFAPGMEQHPGRERGPQAVARREGPPAAAPAPKG